MTADERFDRIDGTLERLSDKMGGLSDKLERVSDKLERVSGDLAHLTEYTISFRTEVIAKFEVVDQRLDYLGSTLASLDSRIAPMSRAILESGATSAQLVREQFREKEAAAAMAARISALEEKVAKLMNPAA